MINVLSKIKTSILLITIMFTLLFLFISFILYLFKIMFLQWVYYVMAIILSIGYIIGIFQFLQRIKNKNKIFNNVSSIFSTLFFMVIMLSIPVIFLKVTFNHSPEHIVDKNNNKYVAYVVYGDKKVNVYYYDYINSFLRGGDKKIEEYYENIGYDPLIPEHWYTKPDSIYYYN